MENTALVSHGYSSTDRQHARRPTVHRSPKSVEGQRTIEILTLQRMEQEDLVRCQTPIILSQRFDDQVFGQILINRESFTVDHSQYLILPTELCVHHV